MAQEQSQAVDSITESVDDALQTACKASGIVSNGNGVELYDQDGDQPDDGANGGVPSAYQDANLAFERATFLENENARLRARVAELEDQLHTGAYSAGKSLFPFTLLMLLKLLGLNLFLSLMIFLRIS